jgi:uncharacterized protein YfkK (UPF0435 family)
MKLTLRKAHRLVKELQGNLRIGSTRKNVHRSATEEEVADTFAAVTAINAESVKQTLDVVDAISAIREALQVANSTVIDGISIDSLLNDKVKIENKMRVLSGFSRVEETTDAERLAMIQRQVKDAQESTSEYRDSYIQINGLSADDHNAFNEQYVQLKREQETVSDKLAYINNKLEIDVDDKYKELFKVLQVL